ncbi:hypothetical protein AGR7B_Cc150012 [Agrobacterium deltaense RV3]|nr:hypothetical protein AGR7B_Cc150012 [Agrobacterium deltaense RV3]
MNCDCGIGKLLSEKAPYLAIKHPHHNIYEVTRKGLINADPLKQWLISKNTATSANH